MVLRNILFLEDIRRDKFIVDFKVDSDLEQMHVPPFLFIPFIENVVKHGAHQTMEGGLHVQIKFFINNGLICFICTNSRKKKLYKAAYGGLGLSNIRKRLEILYPQAYDLQIEDSGDIFRVFLSIPIKG
ncbi:hypothetical protein D3C86_1352140 [compost metagenome]